ncbi:MerR family transcriptional regulator [Streptomyces sp. NRRL S-37]|uniref:MerR family transcriptional regulator n=1 Tax=Streptomyces sp. NRRL S-37 TaxID=1463903 RepID=UPI0004C93FE1|nr:MerR family transcriptional regulator [Streptomyces sp. NRRL S-37]
MSYSVGQVSAFAGVTVRTLHHYDKAGLLSPSDRSHAGYRLYSEADLVRLQQILFYRELGFPLAEIAAIFKDPQVNPLERLRARQRQLNEEIARLQRLAEVAERAIEVQKTGVPLTPEERFEVFGEVAFDLSYATEAELKCARWFTSCPPDMHRRIADDFVADPRAFALVVPPSQQRPGLAAYTRKAVYANAARRAGDGTDGEENR